MGKFAKSPGGESDVLTSNDYNGKSEKQGKGEAKFPLLSSKGD